MVCEEAHRGVHTTTSRSSSERMAWSCSQSQHWLLREGIIRVRTTCQPLLRCVSTTEPMLTNAKAQSQESRKEDAGRFKTRQPPANSSAGDVGGAAKKLDPRPTRRDAPYIAAVTSPIAAYRPGGGTGQNFLFSLQSAFSTLDAPKSWTVRPTVIHYSRYSRHGETTIP